MIKSICFNNAVVRYTEGFTGRTIFNTKDVYESLNIKMPEKCMNSIDFPFFLGLVCTHTKRHDHLFDQLVGINKDPENVYPITDIDWTNLI